MGVIQLSTGAKNELLLVLGLPNHTVSNFYCFFTSKWTLAMPMLVKNNFFQKIFLKASRPTEKLCGNVFSTPYDLLETQKKSTQKNLSPSKKNAPPPKNNVFLCRMISYFFVNVLKP